MKYLILPSLLILSMIACKKKSDVDDPAVAMEKSLKEGLVAYYPFTGTANDLSGNNNHGSIMGNVLPTTDRKGSPSSAYLFDGNTNSYINVPMSPSLKIANQISIAVWIYMEGGYFNPRVLSNELTGDHYFMSTASTSNTVRNLEATLGGVGFCCGGKYGIDVPALSWHHIVFTADAKGVAKLYLDGKLAKIASGTPLTNPNYGPNLNIGRNSYPAYDAWGGKIDELRIYNRPLTETEVAYLGAGN
jgi:hypothetical protein